MSGITERDVYYFLVVSQCGVGIASGIYRADGTMIGAFAVAASFFAVLYLYGRDE